uniref:CID domain-containing protein n=1 Tax=Calcidiscus leptoporus TaxID=127549 RepID=A0A7S0JC65_9EUKA|mmetsp:Transcript_50456/g.116465  ORF Transcript_50456/g.116465 Transcript_50456/m.116465 type:complete len:554 (+) Transcript_50456:99-1760(+)
MSSAEAEDAAASYASELNDLTINSKPIINSLTMIAEELLPHCPTIVRVIESKISSAATDKKLPVIYLLDSICKNVGGEYVKQFGQNLPSVMGAAHSECGPKVRLSLQNLVKTWKDVFPPPIVEQVTARMPAAPVRGPTLLGREAPAGATKMPPPQQPHPPPPVFHSGQSVVAPPGPRANPHADDVGMPPSSASGRKRHRADSSRKEKGRVQGLQGCVVQPSPTEMRQELESTISRLRPLMQSALPVDNQTLLAVSRAMSVCQALIDQSMPGGAEQAALYTLMQELRNMQQHLASGAAAGAQGMPTMLLRTVPASAVPTAAIRTTVGTVAPVNASDLFAKLTEAGFLQGSASASPCCQTQSVQQMQSSQTGAGRGVAGIPAAQPSHTRMGAGAAGIPAPQIGAPWAQGAAAQCLHRLYFGRKLQCTTCARRFEDGQQEELRMHMDDHFKRKQKGKSSALASRRWLLPLSEWASADGGRPDESTVFDALQPIKAGDVSASAEVPMVRAPSDTARVECLLCGEEVKIIWDAKADEWMLRDAKYEQDGSIVHASCAA